MSEQLIEDIRNGSMQAFRVIYDQHYPVLCRFAFQFLNDRGLAEEIVDDSIFYLWEHRKDLRLEHSVRAYLMTAVKNKCLNELNSLRSRSQMAFSNITHQENREFLESVFVDQQHPMGILLEKELEERILFFINTLPDECRRVFVMSRFENKKYREIAEELGISINTVKYHMKNALAYLEKHLNPYLRFVVFLWLFDKPFT